MATIILLNDAEYVNVQGAGATRYNGVYQKDLSTLQSTVVGSDTIKSYKYIKLGDTEVLAPVINAGTGSIEWYILDTPSGPNAYYTPSVLLTDPDAITKINQTFVAFDSLDNPPPTATIFLPGPIPGRSWAEHLRLRVLGYI
jgi:hypothetical protein